MTVYEKILKLRTMHDMTQVQIAKIAGVSDKAVSTWEKGTKEPRMGAIQKLCYHFNIDINKFVDDDVPLMECFNKDALPIGAEPLDIARLKRVPILGRIAAGRPITAIEHVEGYTYTDLNGGADYFALRVRGDSMNAARINEGDVVIVRQQDIVDNGQIAVVMVNGDDATLKRFRQDGRTITLSPQSTNPTHQPIVLDAIRDNVRVLGLVVEVSFCPV